MLHQPPHHRAGAFDQAGAAQEPRTDDKGARADVPKLFDGVKFHQPAPFEGHEDAIDRRRRLVGFGGQRGQRLALVFAEKFEHLHRAVQRFDGVLRGLVGPVAGAATGAAGFGGGIILGNHIMPLI